ncbi:hypothetical protein ANCDUO_10803 [Ancylostoma duodenale]|uniref:Uncharacterized protein n=1 Tax=Ancylostoma duodenale TaxID=51022 RepID=A0A0C2CQE7_9BILA|nr:hypothetical protein ANCDUO_10803 [Ancylostoma duodenale]
MEKIRKKYRDQDDEEREMRMALLGCRGKPKAEEQPAATNVKQNKGPGKNAQGSAGSNERSESPKLGKEEDLLNSNQEAGTSPGTEAKAIEERTSNAVDERLGKDVKCQQGSLNEEVAWSEEMEKQPPNFENVPITEPVPPESKRLHVTVYFKFDEIGVVFYYYLHDDVENHLVGKKYKSTAVILEHNTGDVKKKWSW